LSRYSYLVGRLIIQEREQANEATQLYWFKHKFEVFTIYFILFLNYYELFGN
jgi:hypothetical protein